jgi:hypothetical protein
MPPSGKMASRSPSRSTCAARSKAASYTSGSSFCGAIGDGLGQLEQRSPAPAAEDAVVHHEMDGPRAGRHQQHGVDKAHVVAHQHGRALARDVLVALHLEAVHERDSTQATKRSRYSGTSMKM